MVIDEKKQHILTNFHPARKSRKAIDSDNMTIYMDIKIEYDKMQPERQEIYNFKESQGQEKFKMSTTNTKEFSECFKKKSSLINQVEKWSKTLLSFIKRFGSEMGAVSLQMLF